MAEGSVLGIFTHKVGPLPGWGWAGIVGVAALALMTLKGKKKTGSGDGAAANVSASGEFQSAQSQETVDPVTGNRSTSSYQASGPTSGGWGGGVGLPMGYPMPYSGGDVFVNLPGDTATMNPAQPATTVHYPPKVAPGPQAGQYGGYWWTPLNDDDAANFALRSVPGLNPGNVPHNETRIMVSNPQVDWTKGDYRELIGKALYIPAGTISGWNEPHNQSPWPLPKGASLNAPAGYSPPVQQTTVSNG
jgi:hypothetical protein